MPTEQRVLPLPEGYRHLDVLAFQGRDPLSPSERAVADGFDKAFLMNGIGLTLSVRFAADRALVQVVADGEASASLADGVVGMVARMLGLQQQLDPFLHRWRDDPELGPLLHANAGLRVPLAATPFEALSWAITGQQISLSAALSLRRRLVLACNRPHHGGLLCYPDAAALLSLGSETLRRAGLSRAKADALLIVAEAVLSGRLELDRWLEHFDEAALRSQLLAIRGIGPWTVNYTLLRGYGWLDGSLHGDAAVRRGLRQLLGLTETPSADFCAEWLARFSPWRALVAAHLWSLSAQKRR